MKKNKSLLAKLAIAGAVFVAGISSANASVSWTIGTIDLVTYSGNSPGYDLPYLSSITGPGSASSYLSFGVHVSQQSASLVTNYGYGQVYGPQATDTFSYVYNGLFSSLYGTNARRVILTPGSGMGVDYGKVRWGSSYFCLYQDGYVDITPRAYNHTCAGTFEGATLVDITNTINPVPPPTPPFTANGNTCTAIYQKNLSGITWYSSSYGTLTPASWTSNNPGSLGWQDTANGGLDTDYMRGIYFGTGSSIPHDVMQWPNASGSKANVELSETQSVGGFLGIQTITNQVNGWLRVAQKRSGQFRAFDVFQVAGPNYGTVIGQGNVKWGTINNGSITPINGSAQSLYGSGSSATVILQSGLANYVDFYPAPTFDAVRFGRTASGTTLTSCSNTSYSCSWQVNGSGSFDCAGTYIYVAGLGDSESGPCGISAEGYCAPTRTFANAIPGQTPILDGSGATVGYQWNPQTSPVKDKGSGIFNCDLDNDGQTSFTEFLTCVISIPSKAWALAMENYDSMKQVINSIQNISGTGGQTFGLGEWLVPSANASDLATMFTQDIVERNQDHEIQPGENYFKLQKATMWMVWITVFLAFILVLAMVI